MGGSTTYTRKLDSTGRIMIPVRLRDQAGMSTGQDYDFEYMEKDGYKYIAINCGPIGDPISLEEAMQLLRKHGYKFVKDDYGQTDENVVECSQPKESEETS